MSCVARVTMHRAIAVWLTERPWRAAGAIAFFGALTQLIPPLTVLVCAIPVLSALRFDARIGLGVVKSGSPMPREITSFIVAAMSKNFRIPEGFNPATRFDRR